MFSNLIKTVSFSTLNYQKLPESHSYFVTKIKKVDAQGKVSACADDIDKPGV